MTLQFGKTADMKAFNLTVFVFNFLLPNVSSRAFKPMPTPMHTPPPSSMLTVMCICSEKQGLMLEK